VWWVELGPLSDPERVPAAVAAVLGLREERERPLIGTLAEQLRGADLVLVIDNCEHVLDAVAGLAGQLLAAAPGVRMLCTSREQLGLPGEVAWRVASLDEQTPAELFSERAAQARRLARRCRSGGGDRPHLPSPRRPAPGHRAGRGLSGACAQGRCGPLPRPRRLRVLPVLGRHPAVEREPQTAFGPTGVPGAARRLRPLRQRAAAGLGVRDRSRLPPSGRHRTLHPPGGNERASLCHRLYPRRGASRYRHAAGPVTVKRRTFGTQATARRPLVQPESVCHQAAAAAAAAAAAGIFNSSGTPAGS
jgi:hypothetical protein